MAFNLQVQDMGGTPVLLVSGYYDDLAHADVAREVEQFFAQGKTGVVIDLAGCKVINSPGVTGLVSLALRVHHDFRGRMAFCGLDPTKTRVFKLVGLAGLADLTTDVSGAVCAVRQPWEDRGSEG